MNILICPDKFKGSLTALEVCDATRAGLRKIRPDATFTAVPLADGGEGTCELLTAWYRGSMVTHAVHGPLFAPVAGRYGLSSDGDSAFIEMASASGLALLPPDERDPLITTTLGTGELIADALKRNVRNIVLGIGGSATNDAGIGMATALGYVFYDAAGTALKPVGENLIHIHHIQTDSVNPRLKHARVTTLCDVTNPLYGHQGAAYVYGGQKGADASAIAQLDAGLRNFSRVVQKQLGQNVDFPGAGAAGGLGAGCKVFLNATIEKGIDFIIEHTRLTAKIAEADLVITGEGKIDNQTFSGKVVSAVTRLAREAGKPVIAVCGRSDLSEAETNSLGLDLVIPLVDAQTSTDAAMHQAAALLSDKVSKATATIPWLSAMFLGRQ